MKNKTLLLIITIISITAAIYIIQKPETIKTDSGETITLGPISSESAPIEIGAVAPDFTLKNYDNAIKRLSDYRGKTVVLNFWATWCPFCVDEMPDFQTAYSAINSDEFEIIAVNRGETLKKAKEFSDSLKLSYTLLLNSKDDVAQAYKVQAMPTTLFIDEEGIIRDIKRGPIELPELKTKFEKNFGFNFEIPEETAERKISITDGVKHNVPLAEIRGGGPRKDGIPSIDEPEFTDNTEADEFLAEDGLGVAIQVANTVRFYPFQILVWHEIVNDIIEDQPVLITYCPLCGTGIVFEPIVKDQRTEFGTSGKLWESNLVMYDRQTDSYWSQALGEAIVGEMTGTKLKLLPYDILTWQEWKKAHPKGAVLSRKTGYRRDYTSSPYGDYANNKELIFSVSNEDKRYHPKAPSFGIELNGKYKVYLIEELEKADSEFTDQFADTELKIAFNKNNKTIKITRTDTGEKIIPFYGFWFSWIAVHPDSEVFVAN